MLTNRIDTADRTLVGVCAVIWLAVIGVSVAAIVALVRLSSGRAIEPAADPQTPWALYTIIGISAVVILAAIPLLLRARRAAQQEPPRQPPRAPRPPAPVYPAVEPPTEKLRVFGSSVADPASREHPGGPAPEFLDRIWLRFTTTMAAAAGAATLAVAIATYCMGTHAGGAAVAALVVAGIITALMPVIPWRQLRQLGIGLTG